MKQALALSVSTFVSEDLALIGGGLLARGGALPLSQALVAGFLGIVAGDVLLWGAGRACAMGLVRMDSLRRSTQESLAGEVVRGAAFEKLVFVTRFLPGTRLPFYLAAGFFGVPILRFVRACAIAAAAWVPLLMGAVYLLGKPFASLIERLIESASQSIGGIAATLAGIGVLVAGVRFARRGRAKKRFELPLLARLDRATRYEFWPAWIFYLPLVVWIPWLALRYRGLLHPFRSNPGIPFGGVQGESKADILARLPQDAIARFVLVPEGNTASRLAQAQGAIEKAGLAWPLVLKPDAGERGRSVKVARNSADLAEYAQSVRVAFIAQELHPGPYEAGLFYVREPTSETGRIFSITDKEFPVVKGDGRRTIAALVSDHPRYRLQADVFFARHEDRLGDVLAQGEELRLTFAGNHCQGTLFCDGARLWSPALEARIDAIARNFEGGFDFGRFDVRYEDPAALLRGEGFLVLELNGATSESTNLYDPAWTVWKAWRTLFAQWDCLYAVGAGNERKHGTRVSVTALLADLQEQGRRAKRASLPQLSD